MQLKKLNFENPGGVRRGVRAGQVREGRNQKIPSFVKPLFVRGEREELLVLGVTLKYVSLPAAVKCIYRWWINDAKGCHRDIDIL